MSKREFNDFLDTIGGLLKSFSTEPGAPYQQYGCECDDGWLELITELIQELVAAGWTREMVQIKEKYGRLCFYAKGLPENGIAIISKYEDRSHSICERCGNTDNVKLIEHP